VSNQHRSEIHWLRIGAESVAIIASILLAFGIDAYWDNRSDRVRTDILLQALEKEWTQNLEQLDSRLSQMYRVLAATEEVIRQRRTGLFDLGNDDSEDWWGSIFMGTYKPSLSALTALLANDLNNVSNTELRLAIAAWEGVLEEVEPEATAFVQIEQMDFRREIARVAESLEIESAFESPSERMNTTFGVVPPDPLINAMFNDDNVVLALTHRYNIVVIYVKQLEDVRAVLVGNLELLQSELEENG
jgi:hypothetical protein